MSGQQRTSAAGGSRPALTAAWLGLALAATLVAACTSPDRPTVQADDVPLPTPLRSLGTSVSATVDRLATAVSVVGSRLEEAERPYRPSEPKALLQVPRAVQRADLADPDAGYVVVYDAVDPSTARTLGEELATYLGSGFGQTNFPTDAQFSVALVDDTVVFTWWSRSRSDDPDRAEVFFDAVAAVGEPIEVLK